MRIEKDAHDDTGCKANSLDRDRQRQGEGEGEKRAKKREREREGVGREERAGACGRERTTSARERENERERVRAHETSRMQGRWLAFRSGSSHCNKLQHKTQQDTATRRATYRMQEGECHPKVVL